MAGRKDLHIGHTVSCQIAIFYWQQRFPMRYQIGANYVLRKNIQKFHNDYDVIFMCYKYYFYTDSHGINVLKQLSLSID